MLFTFKVKFQNILLQYQVKKKVDWMETGVWDRGTSYLKPHCLLSWGWCTQTDYKIFRNEEVETVATEWMRWVQSILFGPDLTLSLLPE